MRMASRKGFEPLTPGLGNLCSILLSYRDVFIFNGLLAHPLGLCSFLLFIEHRCFLTKLERGTR